MLDVSKIVPDDSEIIEVCEAMEKGEFTYRTRAAENHLSQEQAVDWLTENMGPNSVWVPMHQHKEKQDGRKADDLEQDH